IRTLPAGMPLVVTPAPDGGAYLWSLNNRQIYRLIGSVVKTVQPPPVNIRGLAVDPNNAGHVRIGSRYCQIYESYDWGLTWTPVGNPVEGAALTYEVDFDSLSWGSALCGSASGAWRTSNHGSTWEVAPPVNPEWGTSDVVFTFARSPIDPQRIWGEANVAVGNLDRHPMIIVSDDGGASFVSVAEQFETATDQDGIMRSLILPNQSLIAAHPEQPDVVYFVYGTYYQNYGTDLWRYDKGTGSLSVVHIDDLDGIDAIAFNPSDPDIMYLGLEYEDISLQKADGGVSAASGVVEVSVSPNPFNPTTEIRFSLAEPAQVKLEIFNIRGQKVSTLVNAHLSAGGHSVRWDGSQVASGVYLCRLKAGSFAVSKKIMLLK
ncbi:MAG: T9SS type A sorting domain-containing protein, partial [Candidatus Zixiibacteriota bacterium]